MSTDPVLPGSEEHGDLGHRWPASAYARARTQPPLDEISRELIPPMTPREERP